METICALEKYKTTITMDSSLSEVSVLCQGLIAGKSGKSNDSRELPQALSSSEGVLAVTTASVTREEGGSRRVL